MILTIYIIGVFVTGFMCTAHYIENKFVDHSLSEVAYIIIALLWFVVVPIITLFLIGNLIHVFNAWLYFTIKHYFKQK